MVKKNTDTINNANKKQQSIYSCGTKEQIGKSDREQLIEEKIIWTWFADDELYLMCGSCGHKWIVQGIKDDKIPIEFLRCKYCQNINYDVYRISRQLKEKEKTIENLNKEIERLKKKL